KIASARGVTAPAVVEVAEKAEADKAEAAAQVEAVGDTDFIRVSEEHEQFHTEQRYAEIIEGIGKALGLPLVDGMYDLRGAARDAPGRKIEKTMQRTDDRGKKKTVTISITKDGIFKIVDPEIVEGHAGRKRLAVYAKDDASAEHELAELNGWIKFAVAVGGGRVTREQILNREVNLSLFLREYMNADVGQYIKVKLMELQLHRDGLKAELAQAQKDKNEARVERLKEALQKQDLEIADAKSNIGLAALTQEFLIFKGSMEMLPDFIIKSTGGEQPTVSSILAGKGLRNRAGGYKLNMTRPLMSLCDALIENPGELSNEEI
ncbi:unnamed protein product, partial [marine sediment metagenome]